MYPSPECITPPECITLKNLSLLRMYHSPECITIQNVSLIRMYHYPECITHQNASLSRMYHSSQRITIQNVSLPRVHHSPECRSGVPTTGRGLYICSNICSFVRYFPGCPKKQHFNAGVLSSGSENWLMLQDGARCSFC